MNERISRLELCVPPPILLVALAASAWVTSQLLPEATVHFGSSALAGVLAVLGLALNAIPKLWFRRAQTTVNPMRPASSSVLVTSGLYRFSRNPMYIGHVLLLIAWVLSLGNLVCTLWVPLHVAYLTRFQIIPEERVLTQRFPERYLQYMHSVPRWV